MTCVMFETIKTISCVTTLIERVTNIFISVTACIRCT